MLGYGIDLAQARSQMGATLAFHIILACLGVALPAVVLVANYIGLKRNDPDAMLLARRWSKVMGVLVAVGAVTGTVLSFEMGLLWPNLIGKFGGAFGIPFSMEGIFFLLEAVFVSIYLLGWKRLSGWAHFWSGVPVAVSGILGAWSVVAANSWMNQPAGFTLKHGHLTRVRPLAVFFNPASYYEVPHMVLAAYMVTGFLVASVYAVGMLRGRRDRYHRLGLLIPFSVAGIVTPFQLFVGDTAARAIAKQQPLKFAAMEYVIHTHRYVTEELGGILYHGKVEFGFNIPWLDSILVGFKPSTKVIGLDSAPARLRPEFPTFIHLSFDTMVGLGTALLVLAAWLAFTWWRRREMPRSRWFLIWTSVSGLGAIAAMECGWIVTEEGRQPWVVYKIMLTSQAVTHASGVTGSLVTVVALYFLLAVITAAILLTMARRWRQQDEIAETELPYGRPLTIAGTGTPPDERESEDERERTPVGT